MALGSKVVAFEIELSDVDRGVYETLAVKLAQHPSETDVYLLTRAIAYALETTEGIELLAGMATSDEPAISVRDLTGQLTTWIDIGTPDAARLHKASKAADRVAVYCHRDPSAWLRSLAGQRIHAPDRIELYALPPRELEAFAATLERRNRWTLSRMEGEVWIEGEGGSLSFPTTRISW